MPMHVFATGEVATAANINEYCVNTKYASKPSNTTRTGTTATADPDLAVTIDASKSYQLELVFLVNGSGTGGIKWNFSGSGSNQLYGYWQLQTAPGGAAFTGWTYDGGAVVNNGPTTQSVATIDALGTVDALVIRGVWVTGASAGTLNFNWSLNSAGTLTGLAGSYLLLRRVS